METAKEILEQNKIRDLTLDNMPCRLSKIILIIRESEAREKIILVKFLKFVLENSSTI